MQKEAKFNYGFLFMGLALPVIAEYFLGRACGVIVAMVVAVAGGILLLSGHNHREGDEMPLSRKRKMATFALLGALIGLAVIGLRAVYAREFLASHSAPPIPQSIPSSSPSQASSDGLPVQTATKASSTKGGQHTHAQAAKKQKRDASTPAPMTLNCDGGNCAQSSGQQGGVTAGQYIGDKPPEFAVTKIDENVATGQGGYVTSFKVRVTSRRSIQIHVIATGNFITNVGWIMDPSLNIDGMVMRDVGPTEETIDDVPSGTHIATVHSARPDRVEIECAER